MKLAWPDLTFPPVNLWNVPGGPIYRKKFMIKVNIGSDLHLRHHKTPLTLPGGDVLILAGDVFDAANCRCFDEPVVQSFLEEFKKYERVIFVLGNHEYYGGQIGEVESVLEKSLPSNVEVLQNSWTKVGNVDIFGSTLWTDMENMNPLALTAAKRGMNDFRTIQDSEGWTLSPEASVRLHREAVSLLQHDLAGKKDVWIVSHHAPSFQSVHPRHQGPRDNLLNPSYASELSDFILDHPQIRMWVHGHLHDHFCYSIGDCLVYCNPRGYPSEPRHETYSLGSFTIETS